MGKRGKKWMQREYSWELSCQKTKEAYKWVKNMAMKPDYIYEGK